MSTRIDESATGTGGRPAGREGGSASRTSGARAEGRALALLGSLVRRGRLDVSFADGRTRSFGGGPGPRADLRIVAPGLAQALLSRGGTGLAESWIRGEWETSDLTAVLEVAARSRDAWLETGAARALQGAARATRSVRRSDRSRDRQSGRVRSLGAVASMPAHYNLGNDFYALWLDSTMTYSSALFEESGMSLEQAQRAKYARIARAAGIRPGERVLEIGSGWGGFAVFAARDLGCHVTTITIAREQHAHVSRLVREQGLDGRIDARLQDYREATGRFDRVISIEMIESIDEAQWPTYFGRLHDLVAPGGTVGLQAIVIDDRHWPSYRRHEDFIRTYVFPTSIVPAPSVLRSLAARTRLRWEAERDFGPSYALTLAEWHRRFEAAWPAIAHLGFDERFRRMWRFYLSYCEAGFRTGRLGIRQIVLRRHAA
jgi:cyclopropane-fatty-acyl-phospholipid synthase